MPEIRCEEHKKFGVVSENSTGIFEAVCDRSFCKRNANEVVLHRWDLEKISEDGTIRPIDTKRTKRFRRPEVRGIQ